MPLRLRENLSSDNPAALAAMRVMCYLIFVYELDRTDVFINWLLGLKDFRARSSIAARIERALDGNFGNWKSVGGDVREMRVDYGGGYRVYYTIRKRKILLLLCGGDKRTQQADIEKAKKLAAEV